MNDERIPTDERFSDQPIAEIRALDSSPPPGFLSRLRAKINRRLLAGDVANAFLIAPIVLVVQLLELLYGLFAGSTKGGGTR